LPDVTRQPTMRNNPRKCLRDAGRCSDRPSSLETTYQGRLPSTTGGKGRRNGRRRGGRVSWYGDRTSREASFQQVSTYDGNHSRHLQEPCQPPPGPALPHPSLPPTSPRARTGLPPPAHGPSLRPRGCGSGLPPLALAGLPGRVATRGRRCAAAADVGGMVTLIHQSMTRQDIDPGQSTHP
jgi:hypothetical protein